MSSIPFFIDCDFLQTFVATAFMTVCASRGESRRGRDRGYGVKPYKRAGGSVPDQNRRRIGVLAEVETRKRFERGSDSHGVISWRVEALAGTERQGSRPTPQIPVDGI